MKKSKAEAERDLLAKNHKRLNKAISDLMDENSDLCKRLVWAKDREADLHKRLVEAKDREAGLHTELDNKHADERRNIAGTAMHALLGIYGTSRTMDQIAEQAWAVADAMMRAK